MAGRRVVITGQGWITPLGHDVPSVWAHLMKGDNAVVPVELFDASTWTTNFAAQVKGYRVEDHIADASRHAGASRSTKFALGAAAQAWRQSGLDRFSGFKPRRVGMYLASGEGAVDWQPFTSANIAAWRAETRTLDDVAWARQAAATLSRQKEIEQEPNMALSHLARAFPCRGPSSNCMTACAASTQAIGEAFELIRHGDADAMLVGGAHSMIHPLGMTGFIRLTAMSSRRDDPSHAARPFDQTRDGFVMGEGAGMLVIESLDHALARGAKPLAELAGYGSSADAFRITDIQPDGRGAQGAMLQALRQAGINPREPDPADPSARPGIHYISAHGTGTKENDKIETAAVKGVFGPLAPKVPFSSVKSMLGHLIQAAGAVELMTCVEAIRTGFLPPTMNYANPDPDCDLDYIPNAPRDCRAHARDGGTGVEACLSNSFGFGGQNDTVVIRRYRA
jgi:3-oxoacyl-[acyl-carrier-protein] synthase II